MCVEYGVHLVVILFLVSYICYYNNMIFKVRYLKLDVPSSYFSQIILPLEVPFRSEDIYNQFVIAFFFFFFVKCSMLHSSQTWHLPAKFQRRNPKISIDGCLSLVRMIDWLNIYLCSTPWTCIIGVHNLRKWFMHFEIHQGVKRDHKKNKTKRQTKRQKKKKKTLMRLLLECYMEPRTLYSLCEQSGAYHPLCKLPGISK